MMKEESEKVGLKLSIQKMKIMASGPIISWQIDGKAMETVTDFIFLGSKITADGDCSLEIKRRLLLGRKAMTKLDSILKSRDITLPIKKSHYFAIKGLSSQSYGCESCMDVTVAQLCLTLCDPMDDIVRGILQARILESVVFPFSRGSSQPRD